MEKENRKFLKDVKVISWELQHRLAVVDVKKENLFKCIKLKQNMQWKVWKLKEKETKEKLKEKVKELVKLKQRIYGVDLSMGDWKACKELFKRVF